MKIGALTVIVLSGVAVLSGTLEVLLVPTYVGAVLVPFSVVVAVVLNGLIAWLATRALPGSASAVIPLVVWVLVVFGAGAFGRPEGDVLVGDTTGPVIVWLATLLCGVIAGLLAGVRQI